MINPQELRLVIGASVGSASAGRESAENVSAGSANVGGMSVGFANAGRRSVGRVRKSLLLQFILRARDHNCNCFSIHLINVK